MPQESDCVEQKLSQVAKMLEREHRPLPGRVEDAANGLWSAMFERDKWVPELLKEADHIMSTILVRGPVKQAIPGMDEAALKEVTQRIKSLAHRAEAASPQRHEHGPIHPKSKSSLQNDSRFLPRRSSSSCRWPR